MRMLGGTLHRWKAGGQHCCMPRAPLQALVWSAEHYAYDLYRHGRLVQRFGVGDNRSWQRWLATQTCFAYRGHIGLLNVYYEARARGGCYWYAYRTIGRHTTKRYLGRTETVTLERLEQLAALLDAIPAQARSAPTKRAGASTAPAGRAADKAGREHHHGPADPSASIPATKLGPPHLPGALVQRERLLDLLSGAVERPLTLISAPAGWGKTTLVSQWLTLRGQGSGIAGRGSGNGSEDRATVSREETTSGRSSGPDPCPLTLSPLIAWLSLDRYDNDPARFWAALIAALRYRHPSLGSGALAMLRVSTAPIAVVTALLVELATLPACRPLVLVLDDVHLINDAAIYEALGLLIDRLPAQVRLVISTRVDPELPLARWRVQGRLAEIRAADLRFVTAEIRTFFAHAPAELPDDIELVQLERRTEGWAAGLQLAALGIPPGDGRAGIAGSLRAGQRFLQEYVHSEIVAQQPLAMQRFLLRSAVLTQLSAGLCRAVTGELASNQLLQALERSHLFLTPLDEQRTWYRFHELFREAVLDQLQATEPELLPRLHRRAARWYAEHGFPREAIAHALAAHDVSTAGALIERVAGQLWHRGEARTVHDWIDALPDSVLARHARLALDAALHLLVAQQFMARAAYEQARHAANRTIARVDSLVSTPTGDAPAQAAIEALPTPLIGLLRRRIELLRAFSAARGLLELGDHQHLQRLAAQVEALGEDVERGWELSRLAIVFRSTIVLKHEGAQLVPMLLEAKQRMLRRGSRRSVIRVLQFLAYAYLRAGALSMARSECRQALELIARDDGLPGQAHKSTQFEQAMDSVSVAQRRGRPRGRPKRLAADRAYAAQRIRQWLRCHRSSAVIPPKQARGKVRRGRPVRCNGEHYRGRNVVERCVGWLKECRAVATRYEKLAVNYLGLVKLAMIQRYLRLL